MSFGRCLHTSTLLPNGKVLVTGGYRDNGTTSEVFDTAELYDSSTGRWATTGNMNAMRYVHTASVLANGKVLVVGGLASNRNNISMLNSAELYDPITGHWSLTGNITVARYWHTMSILTNGKVLITGGVDVIVGNTKPSNTAELYDPSTGSWTMTGNMTTARHSHAACALANGKILVVGGASYDGTDTVSLNSAELYDPLTGSWTMINNLTFSRYRHTAFTLSDGKVLVAGGSATNVNNENLSNTVELYDPLTQLWSLTGNITNGRFFHAGSLLPNGMVLLSGGVPLTGYTSPILNTVEVYNPSTKGWTMTGNMTGRFWHGASTLANGKVLVSGGYNGFSMYRNAELYG